MAAQSDVERALLRDIRSRRVGIPAVTAYDKAIAVHVLRDRGLIFWDDTARRWRAVAHAQSVPCRNR